MIDENVAHVANWVCLSSAIVILIARPILSRFTKSPIDATFYLCIVSVLVIAAREVTSTLLLDYGTANDALREGVTSVSPEDQARIKTGTLLTLFDRILLTTCYWLQIALLLLFNGKLVGHHPIWKKLILICWITIVATYIGALLTTFLECRPFYIYWTISANPDSCHHAYLQLFFQGISNIVLDIQLIVIAFPVLRIQSGSLNQRILLAVLLLMGTLCIAVTCIRLSDVVGQDSAQPVRSFWGSIQVLLSCLVANSPAMYGKINILRRGKAGQSAEWRSRSESWVEVNDEDLLAASRQTSAQSITFQLEECPSGAVKPKSVG